MKSGGVARKRQKTRESQTGQARWQDDGEQSQRPVTQFSITPTFNQEEAKSNKSIAAAKKKRWEGLALNKGEASYLLPHFFLIVVGKPGSGKTYMVKQLLNDRRMYHKKFDEVLIVSPSASKMGINVPQKNVATKLNLDWLWQHFQRLNQAQVKRMAPYMNVTEASEDQRKGMQLAQDYLKHIGVTSDMKAGLSQRMFNTHVQQFDNSQRFFTTQILTSALGNGKLIFQAPWQRQVAGKMHAAGGLFQKPFHKVDEDTIFKKKRGEKKSSGKTKKFGSQVEPLLMMNEMNDTDTIEKRVVKKLSEEDQKRTHANYLVILDDVVGEIKKMELDVQLAQLFLNRRHLVANATVSLILVSQKYTMIPARIRSSASWLELFRLNPLDFDTVYKDVVMLQRDTWEELLEFIFEGNDMNEHESDKRYDHMGLWIEYDKYFKNFNVINSL